MTPQLSLIPGSPPARERKSRSPAPARAALIAVLVELTHRQLLTRTDHAYYGRVCRDLEARGATPDSVRAVFAAYKKEWPRMAITPEALAKHYDSFAHEISAKQRKRQRAATSENPDLPEGVRAISLAALEHARRLRHLDGQPSAKRSIILNFLRVRRFPAARIDECADRIMRALAREGSSAPSPVAVPGAAGCVTRSVTVGVSGATASTTRAGRATPSTSSPARSPAR